MGVGGVARADFILRPYEYYEGQDPGVGGMLGYAAQGVGGDIARRSISQALFGAAPAAAASSGMAAPAVPGVLGAGASGELAGLGAGFGAGLGAGGAAAATLPAGLGFAAGGALPAVPSLAAMAAPAVPGVLGATAAADLAGVGAGLGAGAAGLSAALPMLGIGIMIIGGLLSAFSSKPKKKTGYQKIPVAPRTPVPVPFQSDYGASLPPGFRV